jgi:lipocalin
VTYEHIWWANPGEPERLADWMMDTGRISSLGEWMTVVRYPQRFTRDYTDMQVAERLAGQVYA